jgi:hypothetical protein
VVPVQTLVSLEARRSRRRAPGRRDQRADLHVQPGGYRAGHLPSGTQRRYTFRGLSDRAFSAIDLLDRGRDVDWTTLFATPSTSPAGEGSLGDDQDEADEAAN